MTGDLLINEKDAWSEWGVVMGDGFISSILTPAGNKDFIQNESRTENGKRVLYVNPKIDSRELTLTFNIHGSNSSDYLSKFNSFVGELQKGKVGISIPEIGMSFNLLHKKSASFGINSARTFSKLSVKFEEPNPTVRIASGGDTPGGGEDNPGGNVDMTNKLDKTGDGKDVFVTFTQAGERKNINSKETLSVLWGKVKKWFSDLKQVAFSGKASDLTEDETHRFVTDSEKRQWDNSSVRFQPNGVVEIDTTNKTISMPASVVIKNNVAYSYEAQSINYSDGGALKEIYHNGTTWAVRNFSQENTDPVAFYFRSDLKKVWGLSVSEYKIDGAYISGSGDLDVNELKNDIRTAKEDATKALFNSTTLYFPDNVIQINTESKTIVMPDCIVAKNGAKYTYSGNTLTYEDGNDVKVIYWDAVEGLWTVRNLSVTNNQNLGTVAFCFRSNLKKVYGLSVDKYMIDGKFTAGGSGSGSSNFPIDAVIVSKDVPNLKTAANTALRMPSGKIAGAGSIYDVNAKELSNGGGELFVAVFNTISGEYESHPYDYSFSDTDLKLFYYQTFATVNDMGRIWGISSYKINDEYYHPDVPALQDFNMLSGKVDMLRNRSMRFIPLDLIAIDSTASTLTINGAIVKNDYGVNKTFAEPIVITYPSGENDATILAVYYDTTDETIKMEESVPDSGCLLFYASIYKLYGVPVDEYTIDGHLSTGVDEEINTKIDEKVNLIKSQIGANILSASPILITNTSVLAVTIEIPQSTIISFKRPLKLNVPATTLNYDKSVGGNSPLMSIGYDTVNEELFVCSYDTFIEETKIILFYYDSSDKVVAGLAINQYKIDGEFAFSGGSGSELGGDAATLLEKLKNRTTSYLVLSKPIEITTANTNESMGTILFPEGGSILHPTLGSFAIPSNTSVNIPFGYVHICIYDTESKAISVVTHGAAHEDGTVDFSIPSTAIPLFSHALTGSAPDYVRSINGLSIKDYKIDGKYQIPKNPDISSGEDATKAGQIGYLASQLIIANQTGDGPLVITIDSTNKTANIEAGNLVCGMLYNVSWDAKTINLASEGILLLMIDCSDLSNLRLITYSDYVAGGDESLLSRVLFLFEAAYNSTDNTYVCVDFTGQILYTVDGKVFGSNPMRTSELMFKQFYRMFNGRKGNFVTLADTYRIEYTKSTESGKSGVLSIPAGTAYVTQEISVVLNSSNAVTLDIPTAFIVAIVVDMNTGGVRVLEPPTTSSISFDIEETESIAFYILPTAGRIIGLDPTLYTIDGKSPVGSSSGSSSGGSSSGGGGITGGGVSGDATALIERNTIQSTLSLPIGEAIIDTTNKVIQAEIIGVNMVGAVICSLTQDPVSYAHLVNESASYNDMFLAIVIDLSESFTMEGFPLDLYALKVISVSSGINASQIVVGYFAQDGSLVAPVIPNFTIAVDETVMPGTFLGNVYSKVKDLPSLVDPLGVTIVPEGIFNFDFTNKKISVPACSIYADYGHSLSAKELDMPGATTFYLIIKLYSGNPSIEVANSFNKSDRENAKLIASIDSGTKKVYGLSITDYTIDGKSLLPETKELAPKGYFYIVANRISVNTRTERVTLPTCYLCLEDGRTFNLTGKTFGTLYKNPREIYRVCYNLTTSSVELVSGGTDLTSSPDKVLLFLMTSNRDSFLLSLPKEYYEETT